LGNPAEKHPRSHGCGASSRADESRIEAEKAAANTQLALATEAVEMGEATLAKILLKPDDITKPLNSARHLGNVPMEVEDDG
jgi:hypothetical protein